MIRENALPECFISGGDLCCVPEKFIRHEGTKTQRLKK